MTKIAKLPSRNPKGHKGSFGTVGIIGGHHDSRSIMFGGVVLSAIAALRSGVGLVKLIMHEKELGHSIETVPQATGVILPNQASLLSNQVQDIDAFVIGVAFGVGFKQQDYIKNILQMKVPTVIDADALNNIAENHQLAELVHSKCIMTPHPKEYQRLALSYGLRDVHATDANQAEAAQKLSALFGCTVVLKGATTVVANEGDTWVLNEQNPVLATGGSGDALSGIIAGLLAQFSQNGQLNEFDCAQLGVTIHSNAASAWAQQHGDSGLLIHELLDLIPEVIMKLRQN